ncbi:MAG: hypothetical protein AAFV51_08775 [Pseudomonadota bacterium]
MKARLADGLRLRLGPAAAGVLAATALLHVGPEAARLAGADAWYAFAAGFAALQLVGRLADGAGWNARWSALLPIAVVVAHSLADGLVYAAAFKVDHLTGVIAVFGLILHEVGEGAVLFYLLRAVGLRPAFSAPLAFAGAALTTPAGAILALNLTDAIDARPLGLLLGGVAGALLAVATGREFAAARSRGAVRWLLIGAVCGALVALSAGSLTHDAGIEHTQDAF